jgi:NAD(P)-dependent dehydrogenase (short-subunit alcohol dehydrogenase family)
MTAEPRTAIVTAAGRGIGGATARRLAAAGYDLVLLSTGGGASELAEELGGIGLTGSVTETGDLERVVAAALDRYGRIDAVVNNTGHAPKGPLLELTDQDWHHGLDLLLLNVIRMARLVTPVMQAQGSGAIVNISTFSAFEPKTAFPVSSTLRAGLASFVKLYADEHAGSGIRMNNVLPGFVDSYPVSDDNLRDIPMRRYGSVDEVAGAVVFLVSEEGSYITGQNLRVDGGLTRSI